MFSIIGSRCKSAMARSCIIVMLAVIPAAHPCFAAITEKPGTPKGFEDLDQPRLLMVGVQYGGDTIGKFPAYSTPGYIRFENPQDILRQIPNLKNTTSLLARMQEPLPINASKICRQQAVHDCGKIDTESVDVVFDENNLSSEIFIHKDYLDLSDNMQEKYLPLPEQKFSSVYGWNGAVSGSSQQDPNFALSNNAVYAFGEKRFVSQSTVSNDGLRFDAAQFGVEKNGFDMGGGLFRSQPMQLASDKDMAGIYFAISNKTKLDARKISGNDIILYLPRRSFVSIYREGRLYSSRPYEAGNQKIDTFDLPEGAYPIILKIQESDGAEREENRFFAKNQDIPPADDPSYFLQAGFLRQSAADDSALPEITKDMILRAGIVSRMDDQIALSSGAVVLGDRLAVENSVFMIDSNLQLRATNIVSTEMDFGLQGSILYFDEMWSGNIDLRKIWAGSKKLQRYDQLLDDLTQFTASTSYQVTADITAGIRGNYTETASAPEIFSIGPYAQWNIWQEQESRFSATADFAKSSGDYEGSLLFNLTYTIGQYGVSGNIGSNLRDGRQDIQGNMRVWHDDVKPHKALSVGAGFGVDRSNKIVNADADWRNRIGRFRGSVQQSFGGEESILNYSGGFAINMAMLENGIYLGGDQNDKSAVVIDTEGDADTDMKIFVGNAERSLVKVGKSQVLYLPPYQTYKIRISPSKKGLFDYDTSAQKVTLYPGNVTHLKWQVDKFYVMTGKIIDDSGAPLTGAELLDIKTPAMTDEDGYIQAELNRRGKIKFRTKQRGSTKSAGGQECQVEMPDTGRLVNGVMIYDSPLPCVTVGIKN